MKLRNQEPRNFETKKPRNQFNKPRTRNQETKKPSTFFYFQGRESPAPLSIPFPTPAPDGAGPVACRGGPVVPSKFARRVPRKGPIGAL